MGLSFLFPSFPNLIFLLDIVFIYDADLAGRNIYFNYIFIFKIAFIIP